MRTLRVVLYYLLGDARASLYALARAAHMAFLILLLLCAVCLPVYLAVELARGASHIWRGPSCATSTDCGVSLEADICICPDAWRDLVS